jgi:hypothetical protein
VSKQLAKKTATKNKHAHKALDSAKQALIKQAESSLTSKQCMLLSQHACNTCIMDNNTSSSSQSEGPSQPKGTGVDPKNWGALSEDKDLNIEAQCTVLKVIQEKQDKMLSASHIKPKRLALLVSAYQFYENVVSINKEQWTLVKLYKELYNYCFPLTFYMEMQKKLDECCQGNHDINKYRHKFEELCSNIGHITSMTKYFGSRRDVTHLFNKSYSLKDSTLKYHYGEKS